MSLPAISVSRASPDGAPATGIRAVMGPAGPTTLRFVAKEYMPIPTDKPHGSHILELATAVNM